MLCTAHLCTNDINGCTPNHRCWLTHFLGKPGPTSISKSYGCLSPLCKTCTLPSPEVCLAPDLCGLWSSLFWITGTADSCLDCGSSDLEVLQWAAANLKKLSKVSFSVCFPSLLLPVYSSFSPLTRLPCTRSLFSPWFISLQLRWAGRSATLAQLSTCLSLTSTSRVRVGIYIELQKTHSSDHLLGSTDATLLQ